jgi:hypothetical protein
MTLRPWLKKRDAQLRTAELRAQQFEAARRASAAMLASRARA